MIGWLLCLLGFHDWITRTPGLYPVTTQRCSRCGHLRAGGFTL